MGSNRSASLLTLEKLAAQRSLGVAGPREFPDSARAAPALCRFFASAMADRRP
jgi:hypothetical protein